MPMPDKFYPLKSRCLTKQIILPKNPYFCKKNLNAISQKHRTEVGF
jgi:hypothetical protein